MLKVELMIHRNTDSFLRVKSSSTATRIGLSGSAWYLCIAYLLHLIANKYAQHNWNRLSRGYLCLDLGSCRILELKIEALRLFSLAYPISLTF